MWQKSALVLVYCFAHDFPIDGACDGASTNLGGPCVCVCVCVEREVKYVYVCMHICVNGVC